MDNIKSMIYKTNFLISTIFKTIIPPVYSLCRLKKHCRKYITKNDKAYGPRSFLAGVYSYHNKNVEAEKEYVELSKITELTNKDKLHLAEVYYRLKKYNELIALIKDIVPSFPKDINANWYLAMSYLKNNEYHNSIIYLVNVLSLKPYRYEDHWHLGFCYDKTNNLEKAEEHYLQALSFNPNEEKLKQNLAMIREKIRKANNNH